MAEWGYTYSAIVPWPNVLYMYMYKSVTILLFNPLNDLGGRL